MRSGPVQWIRNYPSEFLLVLLAGLTLTLLIFVMHLSAQSNGLLRQCVGG